MWKKISVALGTICLAIFGGSKLKAYLSSDLNLLSFNPLKDGDKICFIGDTGSGYDLQKEVALELENEGCRMIRHTGDVVYEEGIESPSDKYYKRRFHDVYFNTLQKVPFFITLGNHDHLGEPGAWIRIAKKNKSVVYPHFWYADRHGDLCFINLDTQHFKLKDKKVYRDQLQWFEKIKKEFKDCKLKIAVGHHPMYSSGQHGDAKYSRMDAYKKYFPGFIDLFVTGHDHNLSFEGRIDDVLHFTSGAGGKLRDVDHQRVWAKSCPGYLVFQLQGEKINGYFKCSGERELQFDLSTL